MLRDIALAYAALGWAVLPIHTVSEGRCGCGRTDCSSSGKHPATNHGHNDATTDPEEINSWWTHGSDFNIAIRTGRESDLFVLDIDPRNGGDESLAHLERLNGALPNTVLARTGGGGRHFYFRMPADAELRCGQLAPGIDIKANGGFVVAPPSRHASGASYEWVLDPASAPLALVPDWIVAGLVSQRPHTATELVEAAIPEGTRNTTLASLAGAMRAKGACQSAIVAALQCENASRCSPPLNLDEVSRIAESIARYTPGTSRSPMERPTSFTLTTVADLVREPDDDEEDLVDRMLPRSGLSLLVAKPKLGKSTLARTLCLSVARGEPFLGRAVMRGTAVYLALEEKRSQVRAHFQRLVVDAADRERIKLHTGSAPTNAIAEAARLLQEEPTDLLIVDTLIRCVPFSDANAYAEVSRALEPLLDLARSHRTHVLVVHHMGKGQHRGSDAILGSTAILGTVDTAIMLTRGEDGTRLIETQQRYGEDLQPSVLVLDHLTGRLSVTGTVRQLRTDTIGETLISTLRDVGPKTETELRQIVGGDQSLLSRTLRRLRDDNRITCSGLGRARHPFIYSLPEGEVDANAE